MDQLKSTLQQGMAALKKLPLEAVFAEVLTLLQRANALLELPELKQALVTLQDVMTGARQLLHNADAQVEVLGPKLGGTAEVASKALETLRVTLLDAQKLVRDVHGQGGTPGGRSEGDPHGGPQRPGASAEVPRDADRRRNARAATGR